MFVTRKDKFKVATNIAASTTSSKCEGLHPYHTLDFSPHPQQEHSTVIPRLDLVSPHPQQEHPTVIPSLDLVHKGLTK